VNKINILVKALMIERSKNSESEIKMNIFKKEYVQKVKNIQTLMQEHEQLIEQVV
jgi:hypothetical protein